MTSVSSSFFEQLAPGQVAKSLLEALPNTIAYFKDRTGVYQHVNRAFAETLAKPREEIVGKKDSELFSAELSHTYETDDNHVMDTRIPITGKPELVTYRPGIVRWYLTDKIPLCDQDGTVVGLAGLSRPSHDQGIVGKSRMRNSLDKALAYISANIDRLVSIEELAGESGLSVSSLERYFRSSFNSCPGAFMRQLKISHACELLADPSISISEVGSAVGYDEPAVFSRAFRRAMHMTPSEYRKSLSHRV